jgi:hypothetical protein
MKLVLVKNHHLRTFGALVMAHKPRKRPAKADRHTAHGILIGYGATTKHFCYFDQTTNREKLRTPHTIDEDNNGKTRHPPAPQILMDMGYEQQPVLPVITNPPQLSQYPLRSRHKTVTLFLCKLIPLPMHEFTSAPVDVIASIAMSGIDRNNSVTVTFSTYYFGPSFPETIIVSGIHPTLGLDLQYYVDRHRCQLVKLDLGMSSHRLSQWKSLLRYAYILSIDTAYVYTIADIRIVIAEARSANRKSIIVIFTKDDAPNCLSVVGLPQLHFDQLLIMQGHISNMVLAVVHKSITGPKFNLHTIQKQLNWKHWLASEWIQLDNYAKQNMFGSPCTTPIDTSFLFWVWLYSIKPHENDLNKVRGVCDGSTHGGKTMVHGAMYAPMPQQIDSCLKISLPALLGMYLWHADVTNAFSESDRPEQNYYMR